MLYPGAHGAASARRTRWTLQTELLDLLETHWNQPDEGMWEVRGGRQHFTHSKVMAWVAFDRAVKTVEQFGARRPARALARHPRRDPRRGLRARLRPRARHVHAGVRLQVARREPAADADRRLPAADRPAHRRHGRRHRARVVVDGFVLRYPTTERQPRRPARPRGRVPRLHLLARRRTTC